MEISVGVRGEGPLGMIGIPWAAVRPELNSKSARKFPLTLSGTG